MESEKLLEEEEGEQQAPSLKKARTSQQSRPFMLILRWCAVFLICLFYVLVWVLAKWKATEYQSSQYGQSARMKKDDLRDLTSLIEIASLPRNLDEPYYQDTSYSDSSNTSLTAALWNAIDIDSGVIALSDDYVAAKNLPSAQRFPWDKTKGIYIVHGYHNLHCLKIIYISMAEFRFGEPQSRKWSHISHCFDALRKQVLCDADDTPRAVQQHLDGVSGIGQTRQCRDWGRLEQWAKDHTACYKRPDRPIEGLRNIEKYKFCPEDSGYEVPEDL